MDVPYLSRQPYRRPPLLRATDPQRMNWLWRLVCELAEVRPQDVVEALHAAQIPVDLARARSWVVSDRDDGFFPISIAELERNVRALLALREVMRENEALLALAKGEQAPADMATDAAPAAESAAENA